MAKAEEKKTQEPIKEGDAPSMEEILQSIRGVISGDDPQPVPAGSEGAAGTANDDVLELTDMIEEKPGDVKIGAVAAKPAKDTGAPEKSILDDIDAALGEGSPAKTEEEPAAEPAKAEEKIEEKPLVEEEKAKEEPEVMKEAVQVELIKEEAPKAEAEPEKEEDNEDDEEDTLEADIQALSASSDGQRNRAGRLLDDDTAKRSSGTLKALVNSVHDKQIDSPYSRRGTSLEDLVIEAMKPFLADWLNKNLPVIVKKIVAKEVKRLVPKEEDDD